MSEPSCQDGECAHRPHPEPSPTNTLGNVDDRHGEGGFSDRATEQQPVLLRKGTADFADYRRTESAKVCAICGSILHGECAHRPHPKPSPTNTLGNVDDRHGEGGFSDRATEETTELLRKAFAQPRPQPKV